MQIIFIRHGDPDYANDALTAKGVREAELLSERVAKWPSERIDYYCSPLGRARQTASYSLRRIGREAVTYEWLKEFSYYVEDPITGRIGVPWDFMPEYWTEIPQMYDREEWKNTDIYRSNPELLPAYQEVCDGLDGILARHGLQRHHNYYVHTAPNSANPHDTVVIFCHLGITCVMLSHLLGMSPALLFHSLYLAPTSLTVLYTEERIHDIAAFRAQVIGDTAHLSAGAEPVSSMGAFGKLWLE